MHPLLIIYSLGISLPPEQGRLRRCRKGMCGEEFNWVFSHSLYVKRACACKAI
jgi:hypothetical protein